MTDEQTYGADPASPEPNRMAAGGVVGDRNFHAFDFEFFRVQHFPVSEPLIRWILPAVSAATVSVIHGLVRKTAHFVDYGVCSGCCCAARCGQAVYSARRMHGVCAARRRPSGVRQRTHTLALRRGA